MGTIFFALSHGVSCVWIQVCFDPFFCIPFGLKYNVVLSFLPHLFLVVLVVLLLSFSVLSLGWPEDEQGAWG